MGHVSRFRAVAAALGAAGALLLGAVFDPAYAVATPLPTGTIQANVVNYETYSNAVDPAANSGAGFGVEDASEDDGPRGNAFDGGFHLTLNGKPFKDRNSTVDISPDTANLGATGLLLAASGRTAGLRVKTKIGMFGTSERVRVLYQIKNPGTTKRRVTSRYSMNFGSDADTVVERTSNGNDSLATADSWVVTSDDGSVDDDAITDVAVTTAWGDAGGEAFFFESFAGDRLGQTTANDTFRVQHTFKIRPGKTVQLLFFHQFENTVSLAESESEPEFDTLTILSMEGLLNGLSGNFVNWVPLP